MTVNYLCTLYGKEDKRLIYALLKEHDLVLAGFASFYGLDGKPVRLC